MQTVIRKRNILDAIWTVLHGLAEDSEQWVTVRPNGAQNKGAHVLIEGETGEIKAGMGGKFNGRSIDDVPRGKNPHPITEKKFQAHKQRLEAQKTSATKEKKAEGQPNFTPEDYAGEKARTISSRLSAAAYPGVLSQEQKDAVTDYTGSPDINATLRDKQKLHPYEVEQLKHLDSIFQNAKTKEPITVYRGVSDIQGTPDFVKDLQDGKTRVGTVIRDDGFMSASASKDIIQKMEDEGIDAPVILRLSVPKGAKAVSIRDFSSFPEQNEILINRGSSIKVSKIQRQKNGQILLYADLV